MTIPSSNQGIPLQQGADPANLPSAQVSWDSVMENRLVQRYLDNADRLIRNPAPNEGEAWTLLAEDRNEQWDGLNPLSLYRRNLFSFARRTTDAAAINNSVALVSDATLATTLPAVTGIFKWRDIIVYSSSQTADFKIAYTFPGTAWWGGNGIAVGAAGTTGDGQYAVTTVSGTSAAFGGANVGTRLILIVDGEVTLSGAGGTLQLQYAQQTLDPTNTIPAYTGSSREIVRMQ